VNASRAWLLAVLCACLAACASRAPVREAVPGGAPVSGSDESELWYAMERAEAELKRSPLLVRDAALNAYIGGVACKVAGPHCGDLRVYVVDVPQFNASMAPNGMMLFWTGALLRIRDEAELAYVLGHEAGHFTAQHSLRQWRRLKDTSSWLSAFQLVAYGAGAGTAAQLGVLATHAALFKYSRDMEREADRLGFAAMVRQGWAPIAGADLWARLKREEDTRRYDRPIPVLSTHPASQERLNDIRAQAGAIPTPPTERGRDRYRAAVRPLLPGMLEHELGQRRYAGSILVIGELLADAPPEDHGLLAFYLGEAHRRRGKGDDRARAAALYARAVALPDTPAAAWREHGFARRDAGDPAGARAALQRYLAQSPAAEDRAFVQRELGKLGGAQ
jgi:predicted Zn-dependent protease